MSELLLDRAGGRRSPVTMPEFHARLCCLGVRSRRSSGLGERFRDRFGGSDCKVDGVFEAELRWYARPHPCPGNARRVESTSGLLCS